MLVQPISCTQTMSLKAIPSPFTTHTPTTCQTATSTSHYPMAPHNHHHLPPSLIALLHQHPRSRLRSWASPLSPCRTTSWSWVTHRAVSILTVDVFMTCCHLIWNPLIDHRSSLASTRSYTPLKVVGDGSFGTVWLCDWHGTLPPNTPMSAMQCGAGARPEYAGKRLVAVKRMKKRWEGGWDECKKLKELEVCAHDVALDCSI